MAGRKNSFRSPIGFDPRNLCLRYFPITLARSLTQARSRYAEDAAPSPMFARPIPHVRLGGDTLAGRALSLASRNLTLAP